MPYGQDKLSVGDAVYCVGIDAGEVLLFGRVKIGRLAVDTDHAESLDVWAELGSETPFRDDRVLSDAGVDALVYVKADGVEGRFVRRSSGAVDGSPFQGRASIREIVSGSERLEREAQR